MVSIFLDQEFSEKKLLDLQKMTATAVDPLAWTVFHQLSSEHPPVAPSDPLTGAEMAPWYEAALETLHICHGQTTSLPPWKTNSWNPNNDGF